MTGPIEGLLLVDKPSGPTSHDVVDRVRRVSGERRVGHAGTLDPAATGLLPVALGRATRLIRFLPASPKAYEGTLRLGISTTTDDLEGKPLARHEGAPPSAEEVLRAASGFRGRMLQIPPGVSARRVGGQRLYRLARRGAKVDAPPAEIEVLRFDLSREADDLTWRFVAEVSAGTYVRALARDLGAALGCGAAVASLRRIAIGPLRVESAISLEGLESSGREGLERAVVPLDRMPLEAPAVALEGDAACARFRAGIAVPSPPGAPDEGIVAVVSPAGEMLGIGSAGGGVVRPKVVLAPREARS